MQALLDSLRALPFYSNQVAHVQRVPGRPARYATLGLATRHHRCRPLHPVLAIAFQQVVSAPASAPAPRSVSDLTGAGGGVQKEKEEEEEEGGRALRLYTHQVQAINALREGRHVIVSTPTASGEAALLLYCAVM